jgi:hypothetical protein
MTHWMGKGYQWGRSARDSAVAAAALRSLGGGAAAAGGGRAPAAIRGAVAVPCPALLCAHPAHHNGRTRHRAQLEEDLGDDLKWSMMVKNVMFSGKSKFQEVDLIHTGPFGKVRRPRDVLSRGRPARQ